MLITQVSLVHQTCTMSDVSNSFFFRGIAHGIIQRFINLLLERLHLIPEIELSEYSGIVKKLLDSILESSTREYGSSSRLTICTTVSL